MVLEGGRTGGSDIGRVKSARHVAASEAVDEPGRAEAAAGAGWRLALAWIAGFTLIDASIVGLALPQIGLDLGASVVDLAWVSTGYLIALAATLLAAGGLADRFGPRRLMVGGGLGFLFATAASGAAPTFELLVLLRVVQGAMGGILYTVSLALATTAFPPERRATALAIYFTSGALGAVVGPMLGGVLTDLGGWRLVFFAQLPIPAAIVLMAALLLPRRVATDKPIDVPGLAAASIFVAASVFGVLQLPRPESGGVVVLSAVVAIAALGAFIIREHSTPSPAVRLSLFANRRFVAGSVAGASAWFAIMSAVVYPALYLQLGRGFSATLSGVLLLATPAIGLVMFPVAGRLVRHFGVQRAMLAGMGIQLAGALGLATWGAATELWWIVTVQIVSGAGIAITLVASATGALALFTANEAGIGSALFNSLRQLGAALGVALPAVAFGLAGGSDTTSAVLAGSTAAFVLRAVVLGISLAPVALSSDER